MAMGKDDLLPAVFGKVSKFGTPWFSVVFTSVLMIAFMWFLDLENFVKTASTLKLIIFILANAAVIFMRESNIRHYRPKYKAPFYPWLQIIGIGGCSILVFMMGTVPLIIVGIFVLCGLGWYFAYAHGKIKREYALLHVAERVTGIKTTDHLLDEELRQIVIERDDVTEKRFEKKIRNSEVIDLSHFVPTEEFAHEVSKRLAKRLKMGEQELYKKLMRREKDSNIIVRPGFAIISFHIKGRHKFEIALVRTKRGAIFSEKQEPIHAAIIIVSSPDNENFYMHSLMWMVQIEENTDFGEEWKSAKNKNELRNIVLSSWKNRKFKL
jgi:mannitol/fructose-specific phosphotransferase system IIA component (Ntr-type)